jgi:hypothetical protein
MAVNLWPNELFTARNVNGQDYRVSIVWWRGRRKRINVAQPSLMETWDEGWPWEVNRHDVVAEAAVWRGSLMALFFRPTLSINYEPDIPQRLNEVTFREIVRVIVEQANLVELTALKKDDGLEAICHPYRVVPLIGYRETWLKRRIPVLVLFEWPADRTDRVFP